MNIRAKIFGGRVAAEEPLIRAKKPKGAKAEALDTIAVARETHRQSNDRGEDRHRLVGEHARITHEGTEVEVELINLSGGGAMIAGPFKAKLWDRVDLHLGANGTIECAVRWLRHGRVGLEFAHETRLDCSLHDVAKILHDVIERSFPDIALAVVESEPAMPPTADTADDHRAAPRHPLIWKGTLHHDFQSDTVRIRNISATGAMVETSAKVRVGAEPLLDLGTDVSMAATVEWAVGDQIGLRFHTAFDLNRLSSAQPTVAPKAWQPPAYMQLDQEDRWGRLSLSELSQELEGFLKR
ncbi:MAG TPA: PilZ domain-containing protein [Sphingomicrobium sp.]|nr:PilZ domain-containing protein [Sphingomicrobium sp.]